MPDSNGPGSCVKHCLTCKASGLAKGRWRSRLKWRDQGFKPCQHQRAIYERLKRRFLETNAADDSAKRKKKPKIGQSDRRLCLVENIGKMAMTSKNVPDLGSISDICETGTGEKPTFRATQDDRRWLLDNHGDAIKKRVGELKNERK